MKKREMLLGLEDARACGRLRAALERKGRPRFEPDPQTAAIAPRRRLASVTANVRHFQGMPGLRVENRRAPFIRDRANKFDN